MTMTPEEANARSYRRALRSMAKHLQDAHETAQCLPMGWNSAIPDVQSQIRIAFTTTQTMIHDINTWFTAQALDAAEEEQSDGHEAAS